MSETAPSGPCLDAIFASSLFQVGEDETGEKKYGTQELRKKTVQDPGFKTQRRAFGGALYLNIPEFL